AADALATARLHVPELAAATRSRLAAALTPQAVTANPVDVANGADSAPGTIAECADIILADPAIDALLVVGMFGGFALRFSDTLAEAEAAALDLLDAHGIATPPRMLVRDEGEALAAVQRFADAPLALKIVSPDIL